MCDQPKVTSAMARQWYEWELAAVCLVTEVTLLSIGGGLARASSPPQSCALMRVVCCCVVRAQVLCIQGFLVCRKHADRIILLVEMMANSGCPCFKVLLGLLHPPQPAAASKSVPPAWTVAWLMCMPLLLPLLTARRLHTCHSAL